MSNFFTRGLRKKVLHSKKKGKQHSASKPYTLKQSSSFKDRQRSAATRRFQ